MRKILVTGGAGFIGSHLVDRLVAEGYETVVIDNLSAGRREYVNPAAKFYEADICDGEKIKEIFDSESRELGIDYVFHLAAQIDVRFSVAHPALDNKINLLGGVNILENSRKNGVKKIIFTSTGGVMYGDAEEVPTPESCAPAPTSPYGIHKLALEKYLNYYYKVFGQNYLALRLANVYGPRQFSKGEAGVITIFIDGAVNGKQITVNGDGRQTRDFVYIDDAVAACVLAMNSNYAGEINISTATETNLLEIIDMIENIIGGKIKKKFGPAKEGDPERSCLSYQKAKEILGWEPKINIKEGIKRTIEWTRNK